MHFFDIDLRLEDIRNFGAHEKIIKKIIYGLENGHLDLGANPTLGDILDLSHKELQKIPYLGKKYLQMFDLMKQDLLSSKDLKLNASEEFLYEPKPYLDIAKTAQLNRLQIGEEKRKALDKIERLGFGTSVEEIIALDIAGLKDIQGFGKKYLENILSIKNWCLDEISKICNGEIELNKLESVLLLPIDFNISLVDLDEILLDDLDIFCSSLSKIESIVFNKRWGFTARKSTLSDIGEEFGVTRERIRQIEIKVNESFQKQKRPSNEVVERTILENLSINISQRFPHLSQCFFDNSSLISFLTFCSGGLDIHGLLNPDVDKLSLTQGFVKEGAPLTKGDLFDVLEESMDSSYNIDVVIDYLQREDFLLISNGYIFPRNMKKQDAIACILARNPAGLPWKDISLIINKMEISKSRFSETRTDSGSFSDNDNYYLTGKGLYKHTKFMPIDISEYSKIIKETKNRLAEFSRPVAHLSEIIATSDFLNSIDYHACRYVVKMFGEDEGIYFNGKSQADTISILPNFSSMNQKQVILNRIGDTDGPLTKSEIAQLIKSRSLAHAALYVEELTKDGMLVQVDRMLYTTPEKAFDGVDYVRLGEFLKEKIRMSDKPVHPSVLQPIANKAFGYAYSSNFYDAFLKFWCDDLEIYRSSHIYFHSKMPFASMKEMLDQNVDPDWNTAKIIKEVQNKVCITDSVIRTSLGNWRNTKQSG